MHVFWAHTAPVNPAGTTVPLTHAQLWKGLEIKSHRPTQFVGIMESSEVLEVRPNGLLRRILFKEGSTGPQGPIDEDIVFFGEMKAEFHMLANDVRIANIISEGPDGELYLTFTFDWPFPDVADGSPEAAAKEEEIRQLSVKTVAATIDVIRKLVETDALKL